ncbi:unnamed protein product [marine sediment metagenome]|uniref:Uncharacterized protein n=1 Tax=marine sediment metagenome TaxID=412755 RepID=X1V0A8_9ZZZZ
MYMSQSILYRGNLIQITDITCYPDHENIHNTNIEDQLNRYTGV